MVHKHKYIKILRKMNIGWETHSTSNKTMQLIIIIIKNTYCQILTIICKEKRHVSASLISFYSHFYFLSHYLIIKSTWCAQSIADISIFACIIVSLPSRLSKKKKRRNLSLVHTVTLPRTITFFWKSDPGGHQKLPRHVDFYISWLQRTI